VPITLNEHVDCGLNVRNRILKLFQSFGYRPYSYRDIMVFCRQFSTMLQAGITILQALKILSTQSDITALNKPVREVATEVERGNSLAAALRNRPNSFPLIMTNMVEVGEAGGALDTVMEKMADHFEKLHDLQEKIRSAILYPVFIICVALVVMAVMVVFVLPQFARIFYSIGMDMPFYSRLLLMAGTMIRENWFLLLLFFFILVTSLSWYKQTKKGRILYDLIRLRFPLFGKIYRYDLSARFTRILSTLLAGGVPLHRALDLVDKTIDNVIISKSIAEISAAINRGESIAGPLQKIKYFPVLLSEMVRVGEETGALEKTLDRTAVFYEREVSYFVERLSTILEPVLLLIVGGFIGLLVFSILSPMYQIFEMI